MACKFFFETDAVVPTSMNPMLRLMFSILDFGLWILDWVNSCVQSAVRNPQSKIFAAVLLFFASGLSLFASNSPNIIFILADDLGYGHLGCYGQKKILTPNIDQLAAEGMRFTQHYAGANVCAPSRSVLMTGLHTGHTPIRANGGYKFFHDEDVTVAEVLKGAGYKTGCFGKWGLGYENNPGHPNKQGFDEFFGYLHHVHAHFYYPYYLWKNESRFPLPENEGHKRGRYADDEVHREALDFIRSSKDKTFFAYIPYTLPHVELTVPEDSIKPYRGKWPEYPMPDPRPGYIGSDEPLATFAGMISRLDRQVGEIMALLKELKIDDNTIIFFAGDNGPQANQWVKLADFFDGNGPLRGYKADFYEGGIRVPLIARWPKKIKAGTTSDLLSGFQDVMPTLAELAGTKAPKGDGISFVPTMLGKGKQTSRDFMYWEEPHGKVTSHAVRLGDWKMVQNKGDGPMELYNLKNDLAETKDVAAEHPEVLEKIKAICKSEHTPERKYPADPRPGVKDYVR